MTKHVAHNINIMHSVLFNVLFTFFLDGYSIVSWMVIQLFLGCFFNVFAICFFSVMTWEGTDPNPVVTGPTATLSGLGPFSLWENRSQMQTWPIPSRPTPSRHRKKKISSAICEFRSQTFQNKQNIKLKRLKCFF